MNRAEVGGYSQKEEMMPHTHSRKVIRKGDKQENSLTEDSIRAELIKKPPLLWVQNVASRVLELQIGFPFFLFLSKNIYCGNSVCIPPLYIG